jgi:signal transduction histidine kinase
MSPLDRIALLGIADGEMARKLIAHVLRSGRPTQLPVAKTLRELRARLARVSPLVIVLEESVAGSSSIDETVRGLTPLAPVIVIGSPERQGELARLVAEGDAEFVVRVGDFIPLAAAMIIRRIRWAENSETLLGPQWKELPADFAEILRHEINNPLTGILGNAELLLSHRDRLPAAAVQRLETVVDLAVRLRETTRRLSNAWESQQLRSA